MRTFAPPLKNKATLKMSFGEVAEWSIAAVLKTVVLRGTRGSNPCLSAEIKISPVKSTFYGTFFYLSGGQPKFKCRVNVKMPTSDKVPLQNRYRKIGKIFCNDLRCKSLICISLTFKFLLVTQLLIIPLQRKVITPTVTELN